MAANAIAGILLVVGLFYLITSSIGFAVSSGEGRDAFQLLLGILLIVVAAVIRFRHRFSSAAEKRVDSAKRDRNGPEQ